MKFRKPIWQLRYGLAVLTVVLALLVMFLADPLLNRTPTLLFFAAVMLSSWYGGFGPGLVATGLSVFSVDYFLFPPLFRLSYAEADILILSVFALTALLISWLNAARLRAEKVMKKSRERYRSLISATTQVVWITDKKGQPIDISPSWQTSTGLSLKDIKEWGWLKAIHPDEREQTRQLWQQAVATKSLYEAEFRLLSVDGSYRDFWTRGVPILDADGSVQEWIGACNDITERKQAELALKRTNEELDQLVAERTRELRLANEQLHQEIACRQKAEAEVLEALEKERELSSLKDRIISIISHEYRTPLTTIQSSAELLERYAPKWTEEKKLTHIKRIQKSTLHLTNLVNDVLFIGQAEADKLEFLPEPLDLEQFCVELVEELRFGIHKQTTINLNIRGNGKKACLDERLVRQILTNLLSNAIKYSPAGGTVWFDLECSDGIAVLNIKDSGIGIPAKDLPLLFESFHRASNVGAIPGTGLGLAIVKKCVDVHGAQITVNSRVEEGTTFTVMLPLTSIFVFDQNWVGPVRTSRSGPSSTEF